MCEVDDRYLGKKTLPKKCDLARKMAPRYKRAQVSMCVLLLEYITYEGT